MHRTLLFFITSIFLCAAVSTRAQENASWELKAVEYERIVFNSDDLMKANEALMEKSFCYKQCGRYADAASTLSRIKMYMLQPEDRADVLYEKELCSYLAGDFASAAGFMEEADANGVDTSDPDRLMLDALVLGECGRWDESKERAEQYVKSIYYGADQKSALIQLNDFYNGRPELKDERTAMIRAFLPPLGHFYTGNKEEGWLSMGLNAAAAGWCIWNCIAGNWLTGILGGGIALNYSFMGNQERCQYLVEKYNYEASRAFNDSLRKILLAHYGAE